MAGEVFRLRRDVTGETFRLLFPFFLSLLTGQKSDNVTFGRGKVFPQALHVAGFLPALYPYSTTESGHDSGATGFPTLNDRATSNRGHAMHTANKNLTRTSLDGVAEMANATETQAGCLHPDLSQNGYEVKLWSPWEHYPVYPTKRDDDGQGYFIQKKRRERMRKMEAV